MSRRQLLSADWYCEGTMAIFTEKQLYIAKRRILDGIYAVTEDFLSVNFTKNMEQCMNADERLIERERIFMTLTL